MTGCENMGSWKIPLTNINVQYCYVLPVSMSIALFLATWVATDREDIVTYGRFRLEPTVVQSNQEAVLWMDVSWRQPKCKIKTQTMAWSLDGKSSYPIEGPHRSSKPTQLILVDKPRKVQIPQLPPGEYEIGFDYVHGQCWPWEKYLPIENSLPERFKFTVE